METKQLDTSLTKVSGIFCFLSPVAIVIGMVLTARAGPEYLKDIPSFLKAVENTHGLLGSETIALVGSVLALPIAIGLHHIMRRAGAFVTLAAIM